MNTPTVSAVNYRWDSAAPTSANQYLLPVVVRLLERYAPPPARLLDVGCGNGFVTNELSSLGWRATGIDGSPEGVQHALAAYTNLDVRLGSVYDDLTCLWGQVEVAVSLEVVEHLYDPRCYATRVFQVLKPGGVAVISTPYHGYWKNLALAVTGRMDAHFTALWDHGHIKFWSHKTLGSLLKSTGFELVEWSWAGRMRPLAKSMIVVARRPTE